jgi:carboxymethylenebutenolidase
MSQQRIRGTWTAVALLACSLAACGKPAQDDYAERMAVEHEGDSPVAGAAAGAGEGANVETSEVEYGTVDGSPVRGYLARPAGTTSPPGIIVIHEWWGLNDNIRTMARELAAQGYAALAVDLYGTEPATDSGAARELMSAAMEREDELAANLRQARTYLADEVGSPRIGVIGWCFGGGWSLQTALMLPGGIDAAVMYYGRVVTDRDTLAGLEAPLLGIFGGADQGIPVDAVREFESLLADLGKSAEIHVYEGAGHAFANPSGTRYRAEDAKDAWAKTLAFFGEHLLKGDG